MTEHQLIVRPDGTMAWLHDPPFPPPGYTNRKRFSEIIPDNLTLRILFRILRRVFGEEGRVSDFTRRWRCMWRLVVLNGRHLGYTETSLTRELLLAREEELFFWPLGEL